MVVRRKKKTRKLRGRTRTMSWGQIGQHRKSGSKGGKGAAGLGKHEWTWTIKYAPTWFGKHGFNPPRIRVGYKPVVLNLYQLEELIIKQELASNVPQEEGRIVVNLESMGIHKLLGRGKITKPVKVIVPYASESAIKKIEEAGGIVVVTGKEEE
ncbi:MAG: 50S ribosomal protein L15 [Desulfurococcales archaeon]|nr:50S ribosomal protein L15 [Desulfurococcales archaeon]MEB3765251.1 50S ribosomal protein L15 [Desulfurococcales archaeon]